MGRMRSGARRGWEENDGCGGMREPAVVPPLRSVWQYSHADCHSPSWRCLFVCLRLTCRRGCSVARRGRRRVGLPDQGMGWLCADAPIGSSRCWRKRLNARHGWTAQRPTARGHRCGGKEKGCCTEVGMKPGKCDGDVASRPISALDAQPRRWVGDRQGKRVCQTKHRTSASASLLSPRAPPCRLRRALCAHPAARGHSIPSYRTSITRLWRDMAGPPLPFHSRLRRPPTATISASSFRPLQDR